MRTFVRSLCLTLAASLFALPDPAAAQQVVYREGFEPSRFEPVSAGWRWDWDTPPADPLVSTPSGRTVFGPFGRHVVQLHLTDLPDHDAITIALNLGRDAVLHVLVTAQKVVIELRLLEISERDEGFGRQNLGDVLAFYRSNPSGCLS